ncbi:hypothetical protein AGRI_01770 [Alishewanella agri BL06]|uniref:HEPN domain-containing protein n=1 Tax=Alishewanella agri BL06 TaxID=1195246 RepID=I9P697_9ALTE|nr:hypothetical protein [Alishewanella agri]EIW90557.1 hypothetical protein AGRI_01770 [Alishewanella agri BL06]
MLKKDILLNGVVVGSYEATGNTLEDLKAAEKILKDKGLHAEATVNDAIYYQANSFAIIAKEIYEKDLRKSPFKGSSVSPFVVNATFSIELYLKAIHDAYGKIRGHNLLALYKGMPKKGKDFFLTSASVVRGFYNLHEGEDILTCLDSLSQAFEKWRYVWENNGIGTEIQSIRYTMHVAHEACCRVRDSIKT